MSYQEAASAGELIRLARQHPNGELLVGEVRAWKLEGFGRLGLVFVNLAGVLVVTASLELFDAVFIQFFVGLARGVVIGRHLCLPGPEKPRSSSDSCAVISHESTDMRAMCARARYNAMTCRKFPLHRVLCTISGCLWMTPQETSNLDPRVSDCSLRSRLNQALDTRLDGQVPGDSDSSPSDTHTSRPEPVPPPAVAASPHV